MGSKSYKKYKNDWVCSNNSLLPGYSFNFDHFYSPMQMWNRYYGDVHKIGIYSFRVKNKIFQQSVSYHFESEMYLDNFDFIFQVWKLKKIGIVNLVSF